MPQIGKITRPFPDKQRGQVPQNQGGFRNDNGREIDPRNAILGGKPSKEQIASSQRTLLAMTTVDCFDGPAKIAEMPSFPEKQRGQVPQNQGGFRNDNGREIGTTQETPSRLPQLEKKLRDRGRDNI